MKKLLIIIIFAALCSAQIAFAQTASTQIAAAQNQTQQTSQTQTQSDQTAQTSTAAQPLPIEMLPPQGFVKGKVLKIIKEGQSDQSGNMQPYQQLRVLVDDGSKYGKPVDIDYGTNITIREDQKVQVNDEIILVKTGPSSYYIYDKYRFPPLLLIAGIFFVLVVFLGGKKGFTSILGLIVSILILVKYIVPSIIAGSNPLVVSLIGSAFIILFSLYLSHGFNRRTTIALISTFITLAIAAIASIIFVEIAKLNGVGEDAFYLQFGPLEKLNLKGLLLGGIIIGTLGVLDDVTTGQVAAVDEISKANPLLTFKQLYQSALSVGREHIVSLVNTLALAYAGASLPLFLIFSTDSDVPLWVTLNSESISEEIVRTLVGSSALVLAVPIATFLASWYYSRRSGTHTGAVRKPPTHSTHPPHHNSHEHPSKAKSPLSHLP